MLNLFRKTAFWEGISLLLLVFIAMPLKYIYDLPSYVQIIGMAHGVLFVAYMILALMVKGEYKWDFIMIIICFVASFIPFGTFYLDAKFLKKLANK